jgi:hypothetical protein
MEKQCKRCKKSKEISEFNKQSSSKDGLSSWCRKCQSEYKKERYKKQIINVKEKKCTKCQDVKKSKHFSKAGSPDGLGLWCKKCISSYSKEHYNKNKESLKPIRKKWKEENCENLKQYYTKRYLEIDKDRLKKYYNENREDIKRKRDKYRETEEYKKWYKENREKNNWKIAYRDTLRSVFKRLGKKKENKTIEILKYSPIEFKKHIEFLFDQNMSWENRDSFHIDHIIPIVAFKKDTPVYIINSLDNLMPLPPKDNLLKNASIDIKYKELYIKYNGHLNNKYQLMNNLIISIKPKSTTSK